MATTIDSSGWSGDGDFTRRLVDVLAGFDEVVAIRVEDSPASRQDSGYAFLSNEIFVTFATRTVETRHRWLGVLTRTKRHEEPVMDLAQLPARLAAIADVGEPDYCDEGMLQFLRTERVVAPWQTRGIKVVELVRIYRAGGAPGR